MKAIFTFLIAFPLIAAHALADNGFPLGSNQRGVFGDPVLGKFLPVNEAFQASAWQDNERLYVGFRNAEGYYLHRHQFALDSRDPAVSFGEMALPSGKLIEHPHLGEMYVFYDQVVFSVAIERDEANTGPLAITVTFQGCSDDGLCYPPAQVGLDALPGSPPAVFVPSPPVAGAVDTSQVAIDSDIPGMPR